MADEPHHHEILIIHRGGHGDHDDHHGGAWKIAFADFMCAMMAFFLVMWLVSANDKTRASVARYFNPVRLVDATTQPRGLHDTKKDESGITAAGKDNKSPDEESKDKKSTSDGSAPPKGEKAEKAEKSEKAEAPAAKEKRLDATLRDNPYVALAEIAAAKGPSDVPKSQEAHAAVPVIGRRGGDAFRDPFEPPPTPIGATADPFDTPSPEKVDEAKAADPVAKSPESPAKVDAVSKADAAPVPADVKAQLLASLKSTGKDAAGPGIDVRQTSEGLVVSLTDTSDFSMFSSGSAVPAKRVIQLMERVAKILKDRPGTVVVRGYTDNKPFKGSRYDNWHLSLDRAQVTHYMLVRGGFDDSRIAHIEGFADRGGKPGIDASSPLNRRIEILLKDKAT